MIMKTIGTEVYSEAPLPATEATLPGASEISEPARSRHRTTGNRWKNHEKPMVSWFFSMVFPIEIIEHEWFNHQFLMVNLQFPEKFLPNDRCPEALEYELFDFYGGVRKPELPTLLLRSCAERWY